MYVKKMLSLALVYPYILPVLQSNVLDKFYKENTTDYLLLLNDFLPLLYSRSLEKNITDALAYCFYYGIKYRIDFLDSNDNWAKEVCRINDCVSMVLAWKFCKTHKLDSAEKIFHEHAYAIVKADDQREVDRFWLFVYEVLDRALLGENQSLRVMKKQNISFLNFPNLKRNKY